MDLTGLLEEKGGIELDIGCGPNKQQGYVGMDIRNLDGVDIVHDFNSMPWPLPDECCLRAVASHVVEHVPPVMITEKGTRFPFVEFMDECWRIMKPGGQLAIVTPHGYSMGFLQDPTHCNALNENTFFYFWPGHTLYYIYRPKPWLIASRAWSPAINIEMLLEKITEEQAEEITEQFLNPENEEG